MFEIQIGGRKAIFAKFFSVGDKDAVLAAVPEGVKRVVFVDTPSTPNLVAVIEALLGRGTEVIVRDHHDMPAPRNPREQEIASAAARTRELIGSNAVISDRATHPACSGLIETGEFAGEGTVIVADPDADGLTAAMKALGVVYDGLDADAAILDGPHSGQTAETLSGTGFLLVQGLATLPPYDAARPAVGEDAKGKLFADFAAAVSGDAKARATLEAKVSEYNAQVAMARELAGAVLVVAPGVGLVDVRGKRPHIGTLAMELDKSFVVTVLLKGDGPIAKASGGPQFSLSVRKTDQEGLNLQELLPAAGFVSSPESGIISNTTFLLHVSQEVWESQVLPALQSRFGS